MKTLIMLAVTVAVMGCAATQSNVVCTGGSKDMTCHQRTEQVDPVQTNPVDYTGR